MTTSCKLNHIGVCKAHYSEVSENAECENGQSKLLRPGVDAQRQGTSQVMAVSLAKQSTQVLSHLLMLVMYSARNGCSEIVVYLLVLRKSYLLV